MAIVYAFPYNMRSETTVKLLGHRLVPSHVGGDTCKVLYRFPLLFSCDG